MERYLPGGWVSHGSKSMARSRLPLGLSAVMVVLSIVGVLPVAAALNDTGLQTCLRNNGSKSSQCAASAQDAASGRDVTQPEGGDGRLGFSFVKVGANGQALAAGAKKWSCVRDAVTGLLWEVKTQDGGLRDTALRYTNQGDLRTGDASSFVASVNAQGLCGRTDWRLPDRNELQGLLDYGRKTGAVTIDAKWFPNTAPTWTWTATPFAGGAVTGWAVDFSVAHVYYGKNQQQFAVRLVSSPVPPAMPQFIVLDDEVLDTRTGLVWTRCSDGQSWDGAACVGEAFLFSWRNAVDRAKVVAGNTGIPWRLPNPKELTSIVDAGRFAPTIDTTVFPGTPAVRYWTSSYDSGNATLSTAYFVNFEHGGSYDHDQQRGYAIRLVRTGP